VLLSEDSGCRCGDFHCSSVRALVSVVGLAGHAGLVPMNLRRDAAAARPRSCWLWKTLHGTPGLVGTVGHCKCRSAP